MNILAKIGNLDNISLYHHICDFTSDLANIPLDQTYLGSTALVLKGDSGLELYMANYQKQWILVSIGPGGGGGSTNKETNNIVGLAIVGKPIVQNNSDNPDMQTSNIVGVAIVGKAVIQGNSKGTTNNIAGTAIVGQAIIV